MQNQKIIFIGNMMSEKNIFLIFYFITLAMFSVLFFIPEVEEYKYQFEIKKMIKDGRCTFMDQHGSCWTAEEYKNYLDKQNKTDLLKHFKLNPDEEIF